MIERQPVAYIRRSFSRRHDAGDVSREFQTAEVRRLAGEDADRLVLRDRDWGISAALEHTARRLDFLELLASIERGEVSTVYAYSADRLARSMQWSARLIDACEAAGTTIITGEGRYAPGDEAARMMFHFLGMQNESALRQMKRKTQASFEVRRARGDDLGPAPYGMKVVEGRRVDNPAESLEVLEQAYRAAGTLQGAARRLNAAGVPTRSGKPWRATTLRGILDRQNIIPRRPARGRPASRPYLFAKLLRCHCGSTMTGRMNTKGRRGFAYECKRAGDGHGPASVSEARLRPLLEAEAARLVGPETVVMGSLEIEQRRAAAQDRRVRVVDAFLDGTIDKARRDHELEGIDAELERLVVIESVDEVPRLEWDRPVERVNAVLRALWDRVELGPDLLPARFVWTVPEWRA